MQTIDADSQPTASSHPGGVRALLGRQLEGRRAPAATTILLSLLFILTSALWLNADYRVPNPDSGKHLLLAFGYEVAIDAGQLTRPFTDFNQYPPGVHLVGALASLIFKPTVTTAVMSQNVVFVPLLAAGCYGAGSVAYGRWAGFLAAAFALATPMVGALFHTFMVDPPSTAMVAVTVWALLASRRFERTGIAALAGVAAGLGMYTKGTFAVFLVGIVAAMFVRGGWRRWRGWLVFAVLWFALSAPWYIDHYASVQGQTAGAVVGVQPFWYDHVSYPSRFSPNNFTWYGWNLINNQLLVPLVLFLVVGLILLGIRWVRQRDPGDVFPELLAGAAFSYVAISFITLDDPRYTLPGLVYVAVIGTGWITRVRRPVRVGAVAALGLILAFNWTTLDLGWPAVGTPTIRLPNAVDNPILTRQLRVASTAGYTEGQPDDHGRAFQDLLIRLRQQGARGLAFESAGFAAGGFNFNGVAVFATQANLPLIPPGVDSTMVRKPTDVWMTRQPIAQTKRKPCLRNPLVDDGTGIYVQWGTAKPGRGFRCPR